MPTELSWIRSRFRRFFKTTSFVGLRSALMGCFYAVMVHFADSGFQVLALDKVQAQFIKRIG